MASAAGSSLSKGVKQVRPLLSVDNAEARKRVLNLYKAWYRQVPYIGMSKIPLICPVSCFVAGYAYKCCCNEKQIEYYYSYGV